MSAIGFVLLRDEDRLDRQRAFRAQARLAAAALQREVDRQVARVEVGRATLSGLADPVGALNDQRAGADGPLDGVRVVGPADVPPEAGPAFGAAGDGNRVRATDPLALPTGGVGSLVVGPLYRSRTDPAGEARPEPATDARRGALTGYVVAVADPIALVRRAGLDDSAVLITLRDAGEVLLAEGDAAAGPRVTAKIDVADQHWSATFEPAGGLGSSPRPWLAVVGGGLGLTLVAAALWSTEQALAGARRQTAERESELRLLGETGPLLQSSLDISQLLPEFTVQLAGELDLDQVGIVVTDDHGAPSELFTLGGRGGFPPANLADLPPVPARVPAGTEVFLPLQRLGRVVGALRLRSRSPLDAARLRAAQAAGDLLAAALGNAELYAREQAAVRRLQELDDLRTSFVSTVSHELRTTVTAIYGFADLLSGRWEDFTDEQRRSFLGRVHRNAVTLQSMVDDLLAFSRLDRRGFSLTPEVVELAELAEEQLERMAPLLERHRLVCRLERPVPALVDHGAFERILANLVSNAAKFAPEGTTVTVIVDRVGPHARLAVEDEGPGVAPDERDRVFSRFYRGQSPAATGTRGTGVGLAVVKELVLLQGGAVAMEEAPGGGARAVVLLPEATEEPDRAPPTVVAGQRGGTDDERP